MFSVPDAGGSGEIRDRLLEDGKGFGDLPEELARGLAALGSHGALAHRLRTSGGWVSEQSGAGDRILDVVWTTTRLPGDEW